MTIPARPIPATDVARAAQDAGFVGWQVVRMVQIAYAESGLNAHAINLNLRDTDAVTYRSLDVGLWQINTYWAGRLGYLALDELGDLFDVERNAAVAHRIFRDRGGMTYPPLGYAAWTTYTKVLTERVYESEAVVGARAVGAYP